MISSSIKTKMKKYPAFFQKVWLECAKIPAGSTKTYGWIAEKTGHPGSARAVGQALAKNPFAPTIPCHRVIRSDGKMGGYSGTGGIDKKLKLLKMEKARSLSEFN